MTTVSQAWWYKPVRDRVGPSRDALSVPHRDVPEPGATGRPPAGDRELTTGEESPGTDWVNIDYQSVCDLFGKAWARSVINRKSREEHQGSDPATNARAAKTLRAVIEQTLNYRHGPVDGVKTPAGQKHPDYSRMDIEIYPTAPNHPHTFPREALVRVTDRTTATRLYLSGLDAAEPTVWLGTTRKHAGSRWCTVRERDTAAVLAKLCDYRSGLRGAPPTLEMLQNAAVALKNTRTRESRTSVEWKYDGNNEVTKNESLERADLVKLLARCVQPSRVGLAWHHDIRTADGEPGVIELHDDGTQKLRTTSKQDPTTTDCTQMLHELVTANLTNRWPWRKPELLRINNA